MTDQEGRQKRLQRADLRWGIAQKITVIAGIIGALMAYFMSGTNMVLLDVDMAHLAEVDDNALITVTLTNKGKRSATIRSLNLVARNIDGESPVPPDNTPVLFALCEGESGDIDGATELVVVAGGSTQQALTLPMGKLSEDPWYRLVLSLRICEDETFLGRVRNFGFLSGDNPTRVWQSFAKRSGVDETI